VLFLAVATLVLAVVANSVYSADEAPKHKKGDPAQFWARIVKAAGQAEGTTSLSVDDFKKGFTASGRPGAAERAQKIVDKAAVDGKITQTAFLQYLKDNPWSKRGKKDGGDKGDSK
jgi:hypothetical protein